MRTLKISLLFLLPMILCSFYLMNEPDRKASDIAKSIVDKIIRESEFEFTNVIRQESVNMQIVDFKHEYGNEQGIYYAYSNIQTDKDTVLLFGLTYSGGIKIWLNDELIVNDISNKKAEIKEIAYGLFDFHSTKKIKLNRGDNKILVKQISGDHKPIFFMREVPSEAELPLTAKFKNPKIELSDQNKNWLLTGPFPIEENLNKSLEKSYPPENSISNYYNYEGKIITWNIQKDVMLLELFINQKNSYNRESYLEWHYANGATMFSVLSAADKLKNESYKIFVKKFCDFTVNNYEYFNYQYKELNALRGTNHRIFRKTMLDDTSGPALPFVQLYLDENYQQYKSIVFEMADYVENDQVRLSDGTLCRPEPVEMTVWADDLFMSVPFLLRMRKITNENKYYDDAAKQSLKFYEILFDENIGLYKHGWFQEKNEKSVAYWGRANGWIVWANSELLMHLPKEHSSYNIILKNYRNHINGLIKQQSESGMWHQVLDRHDSFKETSCTSMYIMGILRGVKNGWLDKSYTEYALKAWHDVKKNIKDDGTVIDICRGTGIGYDLQFYFDRKRFDNDPRGLGAVIQAALEVSEVQE
ncbi:MAG: glycoside hydrolase family 88 protein [Bacteroidetes bacterium]|nr:glycoside hydrolase family 88 protein [Bacteroidota bacterium]